MSTGAKHVDPSLRPVVWGPFKMTGFERIRIRVAIREHMERMAQGACSEPESVSICVTLIEKIIAEEVEQEVKE